MENKEKKLCRAFCLSGVLGLIFYAFPGLLLLLTKGGNNIK